MNLVAIKEAKTKLHAFIRDNWKSEDKCKIVSKGDTCKCMLCLVDDLAFAASKNVPKEIEFSVGPINQFVHNEVENWLAERKAEYTVMGISFDGDHYSEIHVKGNYEEFHKEWKDKRVSLEHWGE